MSFTHRDDVNLLQAAHPANVGAGAGNDRYILDANLLAPNQKLTLSDHQGTNTLHLVSGLQIVSSKVSANALLLTLNNGAVVTVLGANAFRYQTGGDSFNGSGAQVQNFTEFVTQALKVSVPASSTAVVNGGSVTVQPNGGTTANGTPPPNDIPTVLNVAITSATGVQNNTLNAGDVVSITVTMSEATTVTGTPKLALNIGSATVQANYASGSGTTALVFTYTIQPGQTDANGISLAANSLSLNGGTIKDTAGNNATLTHAAVADNAGYKVDTTAPTAALVAPTGGASMVQLSAPYGGNQGSQITAVGNSGELAVTWRAPDREGDRSIFVQTLNADGTTTGRAMVKLEGANDPRAWDTAPRIAKVGSNGEFAVTWWTSDGGPTEVSTVFVQKFNADGTTTGNALVSLKAINVADGYNKHSEITPVGDRGEYLVTWDGRDSNGNQNIYVQKFNADGTTASQSPVKLASGSSGNFFPEITAVGTSGAFAAAWYGYGSTGSSVFVQKFNADGTTTGNRLIQLDAKGARPETETAPNITAVGSNGEYVVTWYREESLLNFSIFVQKFNADGSTTGNPTIQLSNTSYKSAITALGNSGEYVVAWEGNDREGDTSIFVQKFNANGTITGNAPVQLEAIGVANGEDFSPQITALGNNGGYVVTWEGLDREGDQSIFVQKFNANGTTTGNATVQLEAIGKTNGTDAMPQITPVGTLGEFAVSWDGINRTGGYSIFVQKFNANGQPVSGGATVQNTGAVTVRSNESGTAYLVNTAVIVKTLKDITGAPDQLWNSIAITAANTDIALPSTGLQAGNYVLYTADAAGNLSQAVGGITVSEGSGAPGIAKVAITSATGVQNNTLNAGDVVSITVTMSEATTVTGTPKLALNIGSATVQANYASGSGTTALVFTYTIQPGQTDANGISIAANSLDLNGGTIKGTAGNNATLTHAAVADNAGYQVDTTKPTATVSFNGANMAQLEGRSTLAGEDEGPRIAAVGQDGSFVVTWFGQDSGGDYSVFAQRFNANGAMAGTKVQLEAIGNVMGNYYAPHITALGSNGAFAITWYGRDSQGDDSIFVQRFNADGSLAGQTVQLEAVGRTNGTDFAPQIMAVGSAGAFVVSWNGQSANHSGYSLFVQKFNADGSTTGPAMELTSTARTPQDEEYPYPSQITALGTSGEFAVAWEGRDALGGDFSIHVQKFNASGAPDGSRVTLEAVGQTSGDDLYPQLTSVGTAGEFVVTWHGLNSTGRDFSVFVQKFNANGTKLGSTVQLAAIGRDPNESETPFPAQVAAVGNNGEFVVTWDGLDSEGDDSIFVQKFNANGTIQSPAVKLEAIGRTNGSDYSSQVTAIQADGSFAVTWFGADNNGGDFSIFVQKFNANGTLAGSATQLESLGSTTADDGFPEIAALGGTGDFVVAWAGHESSMDSAIYVQKFAGTGMQVRSTEPGMAYLVNTSVAVNTVSDITGAADALWNSVAITAANTDIALPATGLQAGTYQLYTADAAGNLSAAATPTVEIVGTAT